MFSLKFRKSDTTPKTPTRLATRWQELTVMQHKDLLSLLLANAINEMEDSDFLPSLFYILSNYSIKPAKWLEVSGDVWTEAVRELKRGDILSSEPPRYDTIKPLSRFDFDGVEYRVPQSYEAFTTACTAGQLFGMSDTLQKEKEIGQLAVAAEMVAVFVQGKQGGYDRPTLDAWLLTVEQMPARVVYPIGFFLRSALVMHLGQ